MVSAAFSGASGTGGIGGGMAVMLAGMICQTGEEGLSGAGLWGSSQLTSAIGAKFVGGRL